MGGIPYSLDPSKGELANISFSFSFSDCLKGTEIMAFPLIFVLLKLTCLATLFELLSTPNVNATQT